MSSLSDRLKALGVQLGTDSLPPPKPKAGAAYPIESVLPGNWWPTPHGDIFYVETVYKADLQIGRTSLRPTGSMEIISTWAREPSISNLALEKFAFIDTETTGLSGGAGTYTFLIGVGRFEGDVFRLVQFFLSNPAEEMAQLAALEEFLALCEVVVSFNGKSFDVPLINNRYIINRCPPPLENSPQLDLLHLARRLWKSRLPSRTLGDLEVKILGTKRSEQDVPGWMVPNLYYDYLHTGDARPLRGVFYHNEVDVVSLAALLSHMIPMVETPLVTTIEFGSDIIAVGKLHADLGFLDQAVEIYRKGLEKSNKSDDGYWKAIEQLGFIHKKRGDFTNAKTLWKQAARCGYIYAHEELAKVYEHKERNLKKALLWTEKAMAIVLSETFPNYEREAWEASLIHRKKRLVRKISRAADQK